MDTQIASLIIAIISLVITAIGGIFIPLYLHHKTHTKSETKTKQPKKRHSKL